MAPFSEAASGIPEWQQLKVCMCRVRDYAQGGSSGKGSYAELLQQCHSKGLSTRKRGSRLSKKQLQEKLQTQRAVRATPTLLNKRKYTRVSHENLVKKVQALGGNPRPTVRGRRLRWSNTKMKRWIRLHEA